MLWQLGPVFQLSTHNKKPGHFGNHGFAKVTLCHHQSTELVVCMVFMPWIHKCLPSAQLLYIFQHDSPDCLIKFQLTHFYAQVYASWFQLKSHFVSFNFFYSY